MPTAHINGIDCYYERAGSGARLLFLNGTGSTLETSAPLIEPFTERFDVVAHDQRGLGRTSSPEGPYSMADYAADAAALLDEVGWDTASIVGISFGGMVAQELAVTWPGRVERLALLCTSPGGEGGASYPLQDLQRLDPDERARVAAELDTRFTPEWLAAHPGDQALADMVTQRAVTPGGGDGGGVPRGMAEQLGARAGHDVCDRLQAVTRPTLVACGRYDGIAPPPNSEAIVARIPGAELRTYEGGHAFVVQDPAAYPEILEFLAR